MNKLTICSHVTVNWLPSFYIFRNTESIEAVISDLHYRYPRLWPEDAGTDKSVNVIQSGET